jgi:hypothetical protein
MIVRIGNISSVILDDARGGLFDEHCRTATPLFCLGGNFWHGPDAGVLSLFCRGAAHAMEYGLRVPPRVRKDLDDWASTQMCDQP